MSLNLNFTEGTSYFGSAQEKGKNYLTWVTEKNRISVFKISTTLVIYGSLHINYLNMVSNLKIAKIF